MTQVSSIIDPTVRDRDNNTLCQHCLGTKSTTKETFASLNYNNSVVGAQTGREENWTQAKAGLPPSPLQIELSGQSWTKFTPPLDSLCAVFAISLPFE